MAEEDRRLTEFFKAVAEVMEEHEEMADSFMLIPMESLEGRSEGGDEMAAGAESGPERAAQALLSARKAGRKICGIDPRTGRIIYC